jgi:hypothetical protein
LIAGLRHHRKALHNFLWDRAFSLVFGGADPSKSLCPQGSETVIAPVMTGDEHTHVYDRSANSL